MHIKIIKQVTSELKLMVQSLIEQNSTIQFSHMAHSQVKIMSHSLYIGIRNANGLANNCQELRSFHHKKYFKMFKITAISYRFSTINFSQ